MTETHLAADMAAALPRPRAFKEWRDDDGAVILPDARLLNGGPGKAPALPLHCFGATLGPYLADLAASKGAPVDYLAAPLLAFAAATVGAARCVRPRPGWTEPNVIWVASVGAPSSGKSAPLLALKRALAILEKEASGDVPALRREHETRKLEAELARSAWEASAKELRGKGKAAPPLPPEAEEPAPLCIPRMAVADATTEKLARILAENPRGVISIRDELAGLIGNFGKYGGEDAPFYLSAYSGDFSPIDRMKGETVTAPRAYLSIAGGIQPDKFQGLLGRANDGLVPRFLCVWPDPAARVWEVPLVDERRLVAILRRLRSLEMQADPDTGELEPRALPFTPGAEKIFAQWWRDQGVKTNAAAGFMAEFLGKGDGTCARIALVLELTDWAAGVNGPADGPAAVSADAVERACTLFDDYLSPMARRTYADASLPQAERNAAAILKEIQRRQARRFNARDLRRGEDCWRIPGLSQAEDIDAACAVLLDGYCIREVEREKKRGRPAKDYLVNPLVLTGGAA